MQILRGLPPSYQSIVDVTTNTKPFPSFLEAKNMLLLHENREETNDSTPDPANTTTTALYSVSHQPGKSKNKWNKNRGNNRTTSKGAGNSSHSTSTNQLAGTSSSQSSQFAGIMGSYPGAPVNNMHHKFFLLFQQQMHNFFSTITTRCLPSVDYLANSSPSPPLSQWSTIHSLARLRTSHLLAHFRLQSNSSRRLLLSPLASAHSQQSVASLRHPAHSQPPDHSSRTSHPFFKLCPFKLHPTTTTTWTRVQVHT